MIKMRQGLSTSVSTQKKFSPRFSDKTKESSLTLGHHSMLDWSLKNIVPLLLESGELALRHYEKPRITVKEDLSLVTEADIAIEGYLTSQLEDLEALQFIIGEESVASKGEDYVASALANTAYVLDPIDGTAPYAHHIPLWGISIGKMVEGELTEGAIYLPALGELFISEGPHVYYASKVTPGSSPSLVKLEATQKRWTSTGLVAVTQSLAKGTSGIQLPGPVHCLSCAVFPMSYLLLGRYEGYLGKLKLWDLAGGLPLLLKLGFIIQDLTGKTITAQVEETAYFLSPNHPKRWKTREALIFAPSLEACERIQTSLQSKL